VPAFHYILAPPIFQNFSDCAIKASKLSNSKGGPFHCLARKRTPKLTYTKIYFSAFEKCFVLKVVFASTFMKQC
jgi:hypothetical protein